MYVADLVILVAVLNALREVLVWHLLAALHADMTDGGQVALRGRHSDAALGQLVSRLAQPAQAVVAQQRRARVPALGHVAGAREHLVQLVTRVRELMRHGLQRLHEARGGGMRQHSVSDVAAALHISLHCTRQFCKEHMAEERVEQRETESESMATVSPPVQRTSTALPHMHQY